MWAAALKVFGKAALTNIAKGLPKNTIMAKALKAGLGLGAAAVGGAAFEMGQSAFAGGAASALPAIPGGKGVQLPSQFQNVGFIPWWRGAGGKFQAPWSDPKIAEYLKSFALDDAYLKITYRAPHGYVVVRDPNGKPFCLLKSVAQHFGLWHKARKPPISAGEWHKYQTAERVVKKLRHIANKGLARKVSHQFKVVQGTHHHKKAA